MAMKSSYERNREGLESVLKRVARDYAEGRITKDQFDQFADTMERGFSLLEAMVVENAEA
jgi:hypothetical protein